MIRFGPGKDIDLTKTGKHLGACYRQELLNQNDRARGLWRRLYEDNEPGVLLADEVGKGKTYVALAVAFARLANRPQGRVLVLTHSSHMANTWLDRWKQLEKCVGKRWKNKWIAEEWSSRRYFSIDELDHDASNGNLPHIAFASYETLKKFGDDEGEVLYAALKQAYRWRQMRLTRDERRQLTKDIVDCDFRRKIPRKRIGGKFAEQILKCLDPKTRRWNENADRVIWDTLKHIQARSLLTRGARFDILIVDEAHKLEGVARHHVVARLLRKRFDKCILVTATPFALSVHQFRKRLLDFGHARGASVSFEDSIGALPLDEFRKAVEDRTPYLKKDDLEKRLRKHMVRASWDHKRERRTVHWRGDTSPEAILPTLLLERVIDGVLQNGERTHIASRRESLCSSWRAARKSLMDSPLRGRDSYWSHAFNALVANQTELSDPKLRTAADHLVEFIRGNTKVVIFTQRLETSKALAELLRKHIRVKEKARSLERNSNRLRRHIDKVARWLNLGRAYAAGVVKVMAHSSDCPAIDGASVRKWWERHRKRLGDGNAEEWSKLASILGRGRQLPILVRHDADTGPDERNVEKFNLPSSPLVLIATPKAQEGIDLHHYCRHVVLFDLTWNPAMMEQRIGRVHRLGGIRKGREKVTVVYCFQKETYEQVMAERVQQRCEMMQVLLGAGQWLDQDREVKDIDAYRMTFPA